MKSTGSDTAEQSSRNYVLEQAQFSFQF